MEAVDIPYPDQIAESKVFLTEDETAGFILDGDNIIGLFKTGDSPHKGFGGYAVRLGIEAGGKRLDAFDTILPHIYARQGFRVTGRVRWDDAMKPPGWNYADFKEWNNGRPDVVAMVYDPTTPNLYNPDEALDFGSDYGAMIEHAKGRVWEPGFFDHLPDYGPPGRFAARTAGGAAIGGTIGALEAEPGERFRRFLEGAGAGAALLHGKSLVRSLRRMPSAGAGVFGGGAKFFSRLERVIQESPRGRGTPSEWARDLESKAGKGKVARGEIEWAGLERSFPDPNRKITKEEMLGWARREGYGTLKEGRYGTWATSEAPTPPQELSQRLEQANATVAEVYRERDAATNTFRHRFRSNVQHRLSPAEQRKLYMQVIGEDPVEVIARSRSVPYREAVEAFESGDARAFMDKVEYRLRNNAENGIVPGRLLSNDQGAAYGPYEVAKHLGLGKEYESLMEAATAHRNAQFTVADVEEEMRPYLSQADPPSKWGSSHQYRSPGGTNPRELTGIMAPDPQAPGRPFTFGSHFPDDDFFMHVRVSDHEIDPSRFADTPFEPKAGVAEGTKERVLFVDELQSDLHRQGRAEGYKPRRSPDPEAAFRAHQEYLRLQRRYHHMVKRYGGKVSEGGMAYQPDYTGPITRDPGSYLNRWQAEAPQEEVLRLYREEMEEAYKVWREARGDTGRVPDAPMKNISEWGGLGIRRAIAEAVEGGYDKVAIVNGPQSADRYNLYTHFSQVEYDPESGLLSARPREGGQRVQEYVDLHDLDEYIGEEAAERVRYQVTDPHYAPDSYHDDWSTYEAHRDRLNEIQDDLTRAEEAESALYSEMDSHYDHVSDLEMDLRDYEENLFQTRGELEEELAEARSALRDAERLHGEAQDRLDRLQEEVRDIEEEMLELDERYGGSIEYPDYYGPAYLDEDDLLSLADPDDTNAHFGLYGFPEEDITGAVPPIVKKVLKQIGGNPKTDMAWVDLDLPFDDFKRGSMGTNLVINLTPEIKTAVRDEGIPYGFTTREMISTLGGAAAGGTLGAAAAPEGQKKTGFFAGAVLGAGAGAAAGRYFGAPEARTPRAKVPTDEELVARMKGETERAAKGPSLEQAGFTTEDVIGKTEKFGETVPEDIAGLPREELLRQRRLKGIEEVDDEGIRTRLHDLEAMKVDDLIEEQASRAYQDLGSDFKTPVTHDEIVREAEHLGLNPEQVLAKPSRDLTKADMVAIRNIVQRNSRRIREVELELDGRNPQKPTEVINKALSETDRQALREEAEILDRQNTQALSKFMEQRTEFGRALNAMKLFSQYTRLPDGTLDQLAWQAKARRMAEESGWGDLTDEVVARIREYAEAGDEQGMLNYVAMLRRADLAKQAMTLWKAGLLTNPATHVANLVGNTSMFILEGLKDRPAYIVDRMMSSLMGTPRTKGAPEGVWTASSKAALEGVQEAKEVLAGRMRPEVTKLDQIMEIDINLEDLPVLGKLLPMKEVEGRQVNVFLDAYQKFIYRALGAGDRIFRKAGYARSLREQANLRAAQTGDSPEYWLAHATDDMHLQAVADAETAIFVNRGALGSLGSTAKRGAWSISPPVGAAVEYAMPFTMTPANIVSRAIEYSGLGVIGGLYDVGRVLLNRGDAKPGRIFGLTRSVPTTQAAQRRAAERIGRGMVGIVPVTLGYLGYHAGMLTGEYPTESAERNLWQVRGTQAHSVQLPGYDKTVSLERVSPFGNLINFGATLARSVERGEGVTAGVAGGALAIPRYAVSQSFLRGTQQMLDWITAEDTGLGESTRARFAQNVGSGFVPNILRSTARVIDPTMREREIEGVPFGNVLGGAAASFPFVSKAMPPRRDVFGYERERLADPGLLPRLRYAAGQYASPFTTSPDLTARFPENKFLSDVGYAPGKLPRMRAEGETMDEYQVRAMETGEEVLKAVQTLMDDPAFRSLPKEDQQERLRQKISEARSRVTRRYRQQYER
jgi:hypothetical protein